MNDQSLVAEDITGESRQQAQPSSPRRIKVQTSPIDLLFANLPPSEAVLEKHRTETMKAVGVRQAHSLADYQALERLTTHALQAATQIEGVVKNAPGCIFAGHSDSREIFKLTTKTTQYAEPVIIPLSKIEERTKPTASWAASMKQVFEIDPLVCPKCAGEMIIKSFIFDTKEITRMAKYSGQVAWKAPPTLNNTIAA